MKINSKFQALNSKQILISKFQYPKLIGLEFGKLKLRNCLGFRILNLGFNLEVNRNDRLKEV